MTKTKIKTARNSADTALSDQAIDWLVKLNSGTATEADRLAFSQWRLQSAAHAAATEEAEIIWRGVGVAGDGLRRLERRAARRNLTRRTILGLGMIGLGGLALSKSGVIGPHLFADHVTGVGERRTLTLSDGSSVLLNASTALSVDITPTKRALTLFNGQAVFSVSHDANRPFTVAASGGQTMALGTVFDVDVRPADVIVTVVNGSVSVRTNVKRSNPVTVKADQCAHYTYRDLSPNVEAVDVELQTAWRRGKLIFDHRPLGDVIADLQRYRHGRILIANDRLSRLPVTGVFDLTDPESILQTIEDTLPVRITRLPLITVIR